MIKTCIIQGIINDTCKELEIKALTLNPKIVSERFVFYSI